MISTETAWLHLLREPGEKTGDAKLPAIVAEEADEKAPEESRYILCRQCYHPVTSPNDRIAVQGAHHHTFANPHGIVFEIGCFKTADGCAYAGPASDEFTWFTGYSWRVCFCSMCLTHLGWLFVSLSGDGFHGLILDRLIEPS